MRLKLVLFVNLLLTVYYSNAQVYLAKQWDYTYGGNENEWLMSVKETNDKGFLLGGYTRSDTGAGNISEPNRGGTDIWIINTDSNGVLRWDKRFGGDINERLYSLDLAGKGAFILGGFSTSDSSGDVTEHTRGSMDYWVVKVDSLGGKIWDHRFGGDQYDQLMSLVRCPDGTILAGGFSYSDSTGDVSQHTRGGEDFWLVKLDSMGNKLWDKRYGGDQTDEMFYLIRTRDGGFLLGGWTNSDSTGDVSQHSRGFNDAWLVRIDVSGNKLWDRRFGGAFGESVTSMIQTPDGGFLVYCNTTSDSTGDVSHHTRDTSLVFADRGDVWVFKIDSLGNKLWDEVYGGKLNEAASGMISTTQDNGILFGANSFSPIGADKSESNFGRSQQWIVKTDSAGNKLWDKTIYSNFEDEGSFQLQCSGGCYLLANNSHSNTGGYKTHNAIGQNDYWMMKFCEDENPQLPVASLMVIDSGGLCEGGCFNLINNSLNAGVFQWSFPGGVPSSSTDPNPGAVCYYTPGTYDITLIAMNSDGNDTITEVGAITVFGLPGGLTIQQTGDTLSVPAGFNYYQWYRDDTLLFGDTLNQIVATQNGDYTIIIIDSNGCPGFDTLYTFMVGMNDIAGTSNSIHIWPNPARSHLNISYDGQVSEFAILDMAGRVVYFDDKFNSRQMDISYLTPGIYFVRCTTGERIVTKKFVKY